VYRGADIGSDHMLLAADVKLRLKKIAKTQKTVQPDRCRLKDAGVQRQFQIELSNRFSALEDIDEDDIDQMWNSWKKVTNETALKVLGPKRGTRKERWISSDTWKLIDERKILKADMLQKGKGTSTASINYHKKTKR